LHHGQTDSLEHDAEKLEDDTDEDELQLASGRDDDTNNDKRDISECLEVGGCESEDPTRN